MPEAQILATSVGVALDASKLGQVEQAFYHDVMASIWARPGELIPSTENVEKGYALLRQTRELVEYGADIEQSWDKLSSKRCESEQTPLSRSRS